MSNEDRIKGKKFLQENYNAYVGRGKRQFYSTIPTEFKNVSYDDIFKDSRSDPFDSQVYTEESVDISMREADFQRLLDLLGYFQKHGYVDRYSKDIEYRVAFERRLREKHPGLNKAYERYRLLLEMVANGKEIED